MTVQTILNYKKQIIGPFLTSSLMLLVALVSLSFVGYQLIKINALDDKIDQIHFEVVLLENAIAKTDVSMRVFLLSNHLAFSDDFHQAQADIKRELSHIHQLVSDIEIFKSLMSEIEQITQQNLDLVQLEIQAPSSFQESSFQWDKVKFEISMASNLMPKLELFNQKLLHKKNEIHLEMQHALQKALGIGVALLVVILGILFSGYRRTIHLFELAVTSRTAADEFSHDAYHDALTKLPNRRYFEKHLTSIFLNAKRSQDSIALLYLDLDGFKRINDEFGHDTGDEALIYVAEQLKPVLRESDFLARLGGDEFAVVVQHASNLSDLKGLTHRIISCFDEQFLANSHLCQLGVSIGVSSYPAHVESVEVLINQADSAMYQAKRTGKNRAVFT
jgi:diguanylate cyclase (GGDEF)-like protein